MNIFDLYQDLRNDDFCFAYLDEFSDSSTDALIALQDARLADKRKVRKKISFLVTECFQNIVRHSEDSDQKFDKLFGLRSYGTTHALSTVNPILSAKKESLKNSLDHLKELSAEELKAIYLSALTSGDYSDKGGAGLGLIEMARKTNKVPTYNFRGIDDEFVSFTLNLAISENKGEIIEEKLRTMDDYHPYFKEQRVLMMQKGNFSQEIVMSIFELVENNLQLNSNVITHTKSLYLLVELLQNMSANAIEINGEKQGIFQIQLNEKGGLIFQTGNCIASEDAAELKEYLHSIKNLSKIELLKLYNKELKKGLLNEYEENRGGIGLLEILKLTGGNLYYEIDTVNDETSFISFRATIDN
jgi:hypothetical protein